MYPQTGPTTSAICLKKLFSAPRKKVFKAWTDPKLVKKWFAPPDEFTVDIVSWDARLGGRYFIELKGKDGRKLAITGFYEEFVKPDLLVFTWAWEGDEWFGENRVLVELREADGSTELKLDHRLFPSKQLADRHEKMWTDALERLERGL